MNMNEWGQLKVFCQVEMLDTLLCAINCLQSSSDEVPTKSHLDLKHKL